MGGNGKGGMRVGVEDRMGGGGKRERGRQWVRGKGGGKEGAREGMGEVIRMEMDRGDQEEKE